LPALLAFAAFAGCSDPARELVKKYPVNPMVDGARRDLLALTDDPSQKIALDKEHRSWLASRSTHCATLAKVGGSGNTDEKSAARMLEGCFAGFDKQRLDALGQIRLAALAGQPALGAAAAPGPNISIAFEATNQADSLAVSADGRIAAIGTLASGVDLYDTASVQKLRSLPADKAAAHLSFSSNGRLLATASRFVRGTKIWDVYSGQLLRDYKGSMGPIAMLPDGRHMLHADGEKLVVYDYIADKARPTAFAHAESIYRFVLSPDAKRVATVTLRGTVTLWDWVQVPNAADLTLSMTAQAKIGPQDSTTSTGLAFGGNGDSLYTVSHDGVLSKWSVPGLERQESQRIGQVSENAILRLRDGRLVLAGLKPDRGSYLLFFDPLAGSAALVDVDRAGRIFLAASDEARLYVATYRDLRHVDIPGAASFKPAAAVVGDLVPATSAVAQPAIAQPPLLRALTQDAQVETIGIYEGSSIRGAPSVVSVSIGRTDKPVVLVLSSYESVIWRITQLPGSRLRHVLLSGYKQSTAQGLSGTELSTIGGAYAYQLNSAQFASLQEAVKQYTGKTIDRFQGAYSGSQFSIGSGVSQGATAGPNLGQTSARQTRVIRCGGDTIVCDRSDTVVCNGRIVSCR
jgi:WD40 repeat protein